MFIEKQKENCHPFVRKGFENFDNPYYIHDDDEKSLYLDINWILIEQTASFWSS